MTAVEAFGIAFNKNCSENMYQYRSAYDSLMYIIKTAAESGAYSSVAKIAKCDEVAPDLANRICDRLREEGYYIGDVSESEFYTEIYISWAHPLGRRGRTFLPVSVV